MNTLTLNEKQAIKDSAQYKAGKKGAKKALKQYGKTLEMLEESKNMNATKNCRSCKEMVIVINDQCQHCGEWLGKSNTKANPLQVNHGKVSHPMDEACGDCKDWKKEYFERFGNVFMLYGGFDDLAKEVEDFISKVEQKAIVKEREKNLKLLDKAELENWFDMPDTTENWKTWKRIRNTINVEKLTKEKI